MTLTSLYTVFKGKSVNMMVIYNASKVNDRFKPLIQKGKLTDWYKKRFRYFSKVDFKTTLDLLSNLK